MRLKILRTMPKLPRPIITVLGGDQGLGQIKGFTQKYGVIYPHVEISVHKRSTRQLLWAVKSKADGSYQLRNLAVGLEVFIVGLDPKSELNGVIADRVVVK